MLLGSCAPESAGPDEVCSSKLWGSKGSMVLVRVLGRESLEAEVWLQGGIACQECRVYGLLLL